MNQMNQGSAPRTDITSPTGIAEQLSLCSKRLGSYISVLQNQQSILWHAERIATISLESLNNNAGGCAVSRVLLDMLRNGLNSGLKELPEGPFKEIAQELSINFNEAVSWAERSYQGTVSQTEAQGKINKHHSEAIASADRLVECARSNEKKSAQ